MLLINVYYEDEILKTSTGIDYSTGAACTNCINDGISKKKFCLYKKLEGPKNNLGPIFFEEWL
jgi:hypothetical protein